MAIVVENCVHSIGLNCLLTCVSLFYFFVAIQIAVLFKSLIWFYVIYYIHIYIYYMGNLKFSCIMVFSYSKLLKKNLCNGFKYFVVLNLFSTSLLVFRFFPAITAQDIFWYKGLATRYFN